MRMSRPLLLACVVGALVTAGAGTAQAASAQRDGDVGAQAACGRDHVRVYVDRSASGPWVRGYGGFFNCTGAPYATIRLQRYRWFGWETVNQWTGTFVPGLFQTLWHNCAGTHTYRALVIAGPSWIYSRELRTTC
jgi:hypothetical protein